MTVNWYSSSLIQRLFKNLDSKSSNPRNLRYLIIDNTNGKDEDIYKLKNDYLTVMIKQLDSKDLKGSWGHAFALAHAMDLLDTAYCLVVDPDVYVFKEKWDEFLLNEMKAVDAIAIGAPYPSWKLGKYHDFPSAPFCLFKTQPIKELGVGWTPFATSIPRNIYNFIGRQIVRIAFLCTRKRLRERPLLKNLAAKIETIIGVCAPDTGWKIAKAAREGETNFIVFEETYPDDTFLIGSDSSSAFRGLTENFELYYYKNNIMITHKYSTGCYFWRTPRGFDTKFWFETIEELECLLTEKNVASSQKLA